MKKRSICIIVFFALLFTGCGEDQKPVFTSNDYSMGIMETNGTGNKSRITFYNEELEEAGYDPIGYASVGTTFYNPTVYEGELYIIPQGEGNQKDEKKVLRINLKDFSKKIYEIDQLAMNSICTNQSYLYTCNTLSGNSYINRCDKETEAVTDVKIDGVYISKLLCNENRLYAFGTKKEEDELRSFLYEFDLDLNRIETFDISEYGATHHKAIWLGDTVCFSNSTDFQDKPTNTVTFFSPQTRTFDTIQLEKKDPLDLVAYHDYLMISHFDLVTNEGGGLSFYDTVTKQSRYLPLSHGAEQMILIGDNLYILGEDRIYKYEIGEFAIKLVKSAEVELHNKGNYLSGFFSTEEE